MFKQLTYMDAGKSIIQAVRDDDTILVAEPSMGDIWGVLVSGVYGPIAAYTPPPEPTEAEKLEAERKAMRCSMAQLGTAMIDAAMLDDFEAVVALDARAAMAWNKATHTSRSGPLLGPMEGIMTDAEIDDLFRAAMATEV